MGASQEICILIKNVPFFRWSLFKIRICGWSSSNQNFNAFLSIYIIFSYFGGFSFVPQAQNLLLPLLEYFAQTFVAFSTAKMSVKPYMHSLSKAFHNCSLPIVHLHFFQFLDNISVPCNQHRTLLPYCRHFFCYKFKNQYREQFNSKLIYLANDEWHSEQPVSHFVFDNVSNLHSSWFAFFKRSTYFLDTLMKVHLAAAQSVVSIFSVSKLLSIILLCLHQYRGHYGFFVILVAEANRKS